MTVVPSGTLISRPSMLSLGMLQPPCSGLATVADVHLELFPEFPDIGLDGPGRCIRKDADGFSFHAACDSEEVVQVLECSPTFCNVTRYAMNPPGPCTAGRALSA